MAIANPRELKSTKPLTPPPSDENFPRPKVRSGDLCVGCIVWLPSEGFDKSIKCCKRDCCGKGLGEDGYNNPVVVLKIRQRKGSSIRGDLICYVANVTTFSDMNLENYLSKCPHNSEFQQSLPISPIDQDSCVESTPSWLLRLQKGALKKQSYVNLAHIFKVPSSSLSTFGFRNHRAYKLRLSATSYNSLMKEMGLRNEPYEETASLYKTARTRLEALASQNRQAPTLTPKTAQVSFTLQNEMDMEKKKYPTTPFPVAAPDCPHSKTAPTSPLLPLGQRRNVRFTLNEIPKSKSLLNVPRVAGYGTVNNQQLLTPYPIQPPTPLTARYHSFRPFVDHGWKHVALRFFVGCLSLGTVFGAFKMLWSAKFFPVTL
ncbi:hypothetical protein BCIN_04g06470 [Botrytis cinerea B05.10]|uniref:Uncharacterized protein n=1 Tax=Botryotinia fuckeliana (strain B05.10) TaxID=332648 RepID=A0A384JFZ1_BOTFB|nr:hypothetical protein BCIN_04g06470 [Botrytis cinerea B05.10]ATZ49508.1 hypothetical protein BCIN_04g06470 [Botrytis cinerea B05.10]